jgi:hypothetical protein
MNLQKKQTIEEQTSRIKNIMGINEMVLTEQQLGFISMFPTADTLKTKTRA